MRKVLLVASILNAWCFFAQDDLLNVLNESAPATHQKVFATFKSTRLGNALTIETVKKKHLDFRISHRFNNIYDNTQPNALNASAQNFFGFDAASDIRFSFDYGITDHLTVGIGRSRMNRLIDGSVKWRFLEQTQDFHVPVSMALFASTGYSHDHLSNIYGNVVMDFKKSELHRLNYFTQLIIACKATRWLSIELLPGYLYRNYIVAKTNSSNNAANTNGQFTLGFAGRVKLSKRMSVIGDYFYLAGPYFKNNPQARHPLALGMEMETGGHVFAFFFTNASGLIENNYLVGNSDSWKNGQVKFGFRVSRTFNL
jgi:hypothetical protein